MQDELLTFESYTNPEKIRKICHIPTIDTAGMARLIIEMSQEADHLSNDLSINRNVLISYQHPLQR